MKKTVLISGGSRGIGKATALVMAEQGWQIAFTYRTDRTAADRAIKELQSLGGKAVSIKGDTAREGDVLLASVLT